MKRGDFIRLAVALVIAIIFITSGAMRLPTSRVVLKHQPVFVYAKPTMVYTKPAMVAGAKKVIRGSSHIGGVIRRASAREALRMRALGIVPHPGQFARASAGEIGRASCRESK